MTATPAGYKTIGTVTTSMYAFHSSHLVNGDDSNYDSIADGKYRKGMELEWGSIQHDFELYIESRIAKYNATSNQKITRRVDVLVDYKIGEESYFGFPDSGNVVQLKGDVIDVYLDVMVRVYA